MELFLVLLSVIGFVVLVSVVVKAIIKSGYLDNRNK
jgi:hypothetical protein